MTVFNTVYSIHTERMPHIKRKTVYNIIYTHITHIQIKFYAHIGNRI